MKKFNYVNKQIPIFKRNSCYREEYKVSIMEQIADKLTEFSEEGYECVQICLNELENYANMFSDYKYIADRELKINVILKKEIIEN